MITKFTVKRPQPRNPMAATVRHCGAGAHRAGNPRQQAQRVLRRELAHLEKPPRPR